MSKKQLRKKPQPRKSKIFIKPPWLISKGRFCDILQNMKYIDLTQIFTKQMPVYEGDPKSDLSQTAFIEEDGYNDHFLKTGMHVGTHIDAPLHMLKDGGTINTVAVDKFFGNGHLINARGKDTIDVGLLSGLDINKGDIVLILTGFDKKYRQKDYFEKYPVLSKDFANLLVELGVSIVGTDTCSPDREPYEVHKILLGNGVLIIENLTNLDSLVGENDFKIIALPMKIQAEAAPVRVVALI